MTTDPMYFVALGLAILFIFSITTQQGHFVWILFIETLRAIIRKPGPRSGKRGKE